MTPPPNSPDAVLFRLAIFSDVHGNLPALRATLKAMNADAPNAIWYGGDFVGYGPWPDECVQTIAKRGFPAIAGNYDEKTLKFPRKAAKWRETKNPLKFAAFRHAYENLSDASRAYLTALPATHRETVNGVRVLLVHSAPDSEEFGISPLTPQSRLDAIARDADADVIVSGHTHWPCVLWSSDRAVLFVNAGSAGRPGDGDPRAAYAVITLASDEPPRAEIRRIPYPIDEVTHALPETGLPEWEEFAALYREGRATF